MGTTPSLASAAPSGVPPAIRRAQKPSGQGRAPSQPSLASAACGRGYSSSVAASVAVNVAGGRSSAVIAPTATPSAGITHALSGHRGAVAPAACRAPRLGNIHGAAVRDVGYMAPFPAAPAAQQPPQHASEPVQSRTAAAMPVSVGQPAAPYAAAAAAAPVSWPLAPAAQVDASWPPVAALQAEDFEDYDAPAAIAPAAAAAVAAAAAAVAAAAKVVATAGPEAGAVSRGSPRRTKKKQGGATLGSLKEEKHEPASPRSPGSYHPWGSPDQKGRRGSI